MELSGISLVTTEPAPISEFFPMVMGSITEPPPILAPLLTIVFNNFQSVLTFGYLSLVNVTCGPIKTSSSMTTPVGIKVNDLILTLLPMTTPSSI